MDIQEITDIFELFTGEHNGEEYFSIINLAMYETGIMLRQGADRTDFRLSYLAAAIAYYRLQQILAARERAAVTYGGKVLKESMNTAYEYSKELLRDYMQICSDLLTAKNFVFSSFSGREEEI
ncbi:hypothetical protein [Ruminococcus flavefaciens]|uniref:Uncharacterized protein n=1 Tax=Ruminococcus flavefaciens 007c TaxID=1341157 RepID=W7UX95_RUMFL|nr:hypothetical protein [Ruminococcus flavefaciens]EWM53300.1 hypothetical protein RF007C_10030 [Ruminococcus flavefaciens 007c]